MINEKHNDLKWIRNFLMKANANHIRVKQNDIGIILQSGSLAKPVSHVRFIKHDLSRWNMDIAKHTGDWESTPYFGSCEDLMYIIVQNFEWVLAEID